MKPIVLTIAVISVTLFLCLNVSAFSFKLSDSFVNIKLDENTISKEIILNLVNDEGRDVAIMILIGGDLNESVKLSNNYIDFSENEIRNVNVSINIANKLKPGEYVIKVSILEVPKENQNQEQLIKEDKLITIKVDYQDEFLIISDFSEHQKKDEIEFSFLLENKGKLNIEVSPKIIIYRDDSVIKEIGFDKTMIFSEQNLILNKSIVSSEIPEGSYHAKLTVSYNDKVTEYELNFKVNKKYFEIQKIETNNFRLGDIAKFNFLVENKLNSEMNKVFLRLKIVDNNGKEIANLKSQDYVFAHLSKENLVVYWDTKDIEKGEYNANITMFSGNDIVLVDNFAVNLLSDRIEIEGFEENINKSSNDKLIENNHFELWKILLGIFIALVVINMFWFLILKKRLIKKKSNFKFNKISKNKTFTKY